MISRHPWYWVLVLAFWVTGVGFLLALPYKGFELVTISSWHSPIGDTFFSLLTRIPEWPGFVFFLLVFLWHKQWFSGLQLVLLTIVITATSYYLKQFFAAPRPYLYFKDLGISEALSFVSGVSINKGYTSFPSGHTTAVFALSTFVTLQSRPLNWLSVTLGFMAISVGFSRMYLMQHFLEDVLAGSVVGVLLAVGMVWLQVWLTRLNNQARTNA